MDKDFIYGLKKTITKTAQTAVKKSGEMVEITKIHLAITEAEASFDKTLRELGEAVYEAYKNDAPPSVSLDEKCKEADDKAEVLESLRQKLNAAKNLKMCPACKNSTDSSASFCPDCGQPF